MAATRAAELNVAVVISILKRAMRQQTIDTLRRVQRCLFHGVRIPVMKIIERLEKGGNGAN